MKRFFILSLTMILALSAWGDIDFGSEKVVSTTTTWTFEDFSTDITSHTLVKGSGYLRAFPRPKNNDDRQFSIEAASGSVTFGSTEVAYTKVAKASAKMVGVSTTSNITTSATAAMESGSNALPSFAFNASVPGTVYVAMKSASTEAKGQRIYFNNGTSASLVKQSTATGNIDIISCTSTEGGAFFIGDVKGAYELYAIHFVPSVYAPTFSQNGNTVTITAGTCNIDGATVTTYYTTDGSDPTTSSASFTGASADVELTANTTIKALTITDGGISGAVASESFTYTAPVTITFDSAGGTDVTAITQLPGTAVSAPTAPTKDGYDFAGWYSGDDLYSFTTMPAESITLTAHWTAINYTVQSTTHINGSVTFSKEKNGTYTETITDAHIGETIYVKATANPNYQFDSLTSSDVDNLTSDANTSFTMPAKNVDITATFVDETPAATTLTTENVSVDAVTYNGSEQTAVVKYNTETILTEGTDYDITSAANTNKGTNAGSYTFTLKGKGSYTGNVEKTFTINKATLTATADNKSKTAGEENPELTVTVTGFVNSETAGTAANYDVPTASTEATTESPVGTYPITVSGGSATNYTFNYQPGTLTVNAASVDAMSVSSSTAWSFGNVTSETSFTSLTNFNNTGLFLRANSGNAISYNNTSLSIRFSDETSSTNYTAALKLSKNSSFAPSADIISSSDVTNASAGCMAITTSVPGTFYVAAKAATNNEGDIIKFIFDGNAVEVTAKNLNASSGDGALGNKYEYSASKAGTFIIGSTAVGVNVFCIRFVPSYTFKATAGSNGSITVKKGEEDVTAAVVSGATYDNGTALTLTATPNTGYQFVNWTNDNNSNAEVSTDNPYSIPSLSANTALTANFSAKTYTVTLDNQSATNAGTESVSTTYNANTNLTTSITCPTKESSAFDGYFTAVDGGGTQLINSEGAWIASVDGYTDADKNWIYDSDVTLYAKWTSNAPANPTLTLQQPATGGSIAADKSGEQAAGTGIKLTATPGEGYQLKTWKSGDEAYGSLPKSLIQTISMPNSNLTITAEFEAQPASAPSITTETTWTFDSFAKGTILSGTKTYVYEGLYINGHNRDDQNQAKVDGSNNEVETGISANVYNYLEIAGAGSATSSTGLTTFSTDAVGFHAGVPGTLKVYLKGIANDRGLKFYSSGNESATTTDNTINGTNQLFKHEITAAGNVYILSTKGKMDIYAIKFVPASYTFKATAGSNGSITVMKGETNVTEAVAAENGATYSYGTTLVLTPTPTNAETHEFDKWTTDGTTELTTGDDISIDATTHVLTVNLKSNLTVQATFKTKGTPTQNYSLTVDYDAEKGTVTNDGTALEASYQEGTAVKLTATATAEGYQFAGWWNADGTTRLSLKNPYEITMNEAKSLKAIFKQPTSPATAITTETTWTFDAFTAGTVLSGTKVYEYDGLYISGHNSDTSNQATVLNGGTDTGTEFAGSVTQRLHIAGKNNSISASADVASFTQDAVAFSAGTPGVVSAYVKGGASERKYNIYIGGTKNQVDMTGDFQTLQKDVTAASSIFISSSDGGHDFYAIKFTPETVIAPSINDDGTITEGTSNLTTDDNKVIKTYYTLDESEPSTNSTLYEGIIMASGEKTVKAISINTVTGTKSIVTTRTLTLTLPTKTFNATVGTTGAGTITWKIEGSSDNTTETTFDKGTRIEVTATPNSGYSFLNWTSNGEEVAKTATYTFSLIDNTILVANFKDTSSTVPVILTAGQSNTDGRVAVDELPTTFTGLENCYWSYCNAQKVYAGSAIKTPYTTVGNLEKYSPKNDNGGGWAYDAVVYHKIGEQLGQKFYVIKQSKGNTGISPASGGNGLFWSANPLWLSRNESTNKGGRSLLKALIENIDASLTAIETESGKTADIKFLMWHQGEGDGNGSQGPVYYTQLKAVINYVRNHLAAKNSKYSNLPIILGGITSVSAQYNADVEAAKAQLANEDANIYYVDINEVGTDGLLDDVLHFNATGAQTLGNKIWQTIYDHNLLSGLTDGTGSSEPVADILTETTPVKTTTQWDFSENAEGTAYAEKTSLNGLYLHGSSSNKMTVKSMASAEPAVTSVSYSDGETVTTSMALRSPSGDRSKFMTNGLTAGDVVAIDRMIGVNTDEAGTFYAVIAPETEPTEAQASREIYLIFNGEKVATVNALEAWNGSADHTISLKYKTDKAGTFFMTGQHPYLLYAAKFVKAGEETGGFSITTVAEGGNIELTAPTGKTLSDSFSKNEQVTLKATASEGYAFVKWTDGDDNELGTSETLTLTITSDITVKAVFRGQSATTVYDFATVGASEALTYGDKGTTSYYFWTESKAKDGSKNFCPITNTNLAADNRILIRVEDKDVADGKVNYALTSAGLSPTTTTRALVIDNLKVGDRVRIESTGTIQYVSSAEVGEATISDAVVEQGANLAEKTTLTVTQGSYIVLLPAKGAVISKISINADEAMKPTISEPTENSDGSMTYTVKINEGETLHYTAPDMEGEKTVAYDQTTNGSYQIKVAESGKLVCWTTLTTVPAEKSEDVTINVSLPKDEPTSKITIHTIGDSTMSSYDQSIPAQAGMDGWGDYLQDCIKKDGNGEYWATVYNWADRGEGAKSYYNGIWLKTSTDRPEFEEPVADKVKAGDYVIIQFGHNDSKAYDTSTYEEWMDKLVDAVSAKGATPIIASSICRRHFGSDGKITRLGRIDTGEENGVGEDDHTYDYPYHAKLVAQAKNILFIDVTAGTKTLYETYGDEKSKAFFPGSERTHTNKLGAQTIAKVVAQILFDDNTVLKKYVNTDALELPDKESLVIENVISNFKDEDVVSKKTIWTFNDKTAGDVIADGTNTVVSQNGLYVRGYEGKAITAVASEASPVVFSDGTKQSVKVVARTEALNTSGVNTFGSNTAGRAAASGLAPTFAVNIGTPGTFYAIVAPTTDEANRSLRMIFSGKEVINTPVSEAYAKAHHWYEMKYHAETTGVVYLSFGVPTELYAAMFIPDMEKGTEEDWNYQMVQTRSDGYWTYTNLSGSNQSVPDGLTVYAVTAISADGKATLADIGKVIPTGKGFLVKGDPNTEYELASTTAESTYSGENLLVGNEELKYLPETENGKTNYYFDGSQFSKSTGYETIHTKQAYLSVSATSDVIPLDIPEPEVTPPYGTYDFRKFAVENVSANTDKITVEKDANGVLTGTFNSTAEDITVSGNMTLNDAFSVTGSKAANVKMRKNGSAVTSTTSGLFINKSQAELNLLHLKEGNYFKIEYDGGLTFASTNVKKQGASSNVAEGDEVVSGASYMVESGSEVKLNFGRSDGASYIYTVIISENAIVELVEGDLYISPSGNDNNAGTREAPLKTLKAAQEKAQSGNTIAILPGTYKVTNAEYMDKSSSTWNVVYNLDKKSISYIGEVGNDGKRPVFDFSGVSPEDGKRITGFLLKTSGIIIKNIESIGIQIPESSSNVQSENFRLNGASDCLIKNVAAHDGYGIGFYMTGKTKNCVIEDCDAYNNADKVNNTGENNDGFGCHVSENCPGNKFIRCRAWYNADDGFDFISCYSAATVEDCIAWRNGRTDSSFSNIKGNGNGFKAGGYGMKSDETGKAHPMHEVTGCIAVDQPHGFYANHHLAGLKFTNNRAYKNSVDYLMTNRKGEGASSDDLTDVPGYDHEITGNISYGNTDINMVVGMIDTETCTLAGNSFSYSNNEWTNKSYSNDDFVSLKVSDLLLDRDAKGNLPEAVFNFMKLKVPAEIIEDPTVTLKSADESKTIYTVTYHAGAELHYKLPGSSKEQKVTTSESADIEVTTAGILQVWAVKGNSSSSVVKQSVLLLAPVVYDFANTTSDIKADDGTKVRVMTYKDHNDKAQRNKDFWYVTEESAKLRVLTYAEAGKYTQGTGLSLTKANRPIAIEGVKAGDFVRIFHNGGTLLDGNMSDIGTTITDANGNAITGSIESGQLIKITATAGNIDDYVMFQSTTQDFTITKVVINTALDPVVEKDDTKSTDSKWVYNASFCEGETLHYTSPDVSGEQTVNYTGNPITIEVSKTGKLIFWTTVGSRSSEKITRTVDMTNVPAEINLEPGYQTYYAETALDFSEVSTDVLRAYIVKTTTTAAETRAATRAPSASQLELVEVKKVPAKTALILWGKKAATVEIPQAEQTTVVITQVDGTEVNATVNLLKKAEKTESADANETIFVPNTDGELSFEYSSFVTRNGIYIEIPTSVVGEDAKEITLGEPQDDGTIIPLETAVATIKNITPILDTENSNKSKKVYLFKFDSSLKLYYKRPGQDTEFKAQSYKDEYKDNGYPVSSSNSGYLEYYVMKDKESSRTDAKEIMLQPKAVLKNIGTSSSDYQIDFFDGATLYYTLGDEAEKSSDEGSPIELTVTKGVKITAYSKTATETTESLSTNLYAPTPSIVNDSVYGFANIKEKIGIDYVLTTTGYEDEKLTLDNVELYKPNALTSQTLDRFAFSAPKADGKGETSDWRLLNAGRLRATKSDVDKHLLIQGAKKGNVLLLTYSGASVKYVEDLSTAKLAEGTSEISSNSKYEVQNDGDLLLKIPADATNNCDITVISLSSKYNSSSSGGSSSSSSSDDKKESSSAAVTIELDRVSEGIAYYRLTWEAGAEMRYTLGDDETELSAGTSGSYIIEVSEGMKVKCWTVKDGKSSKTVSSNLFPPTSAMAVDGNYDFAEPSDELFADMPITLDMDKKVIVEGQTLYLPNALTYETFKDRFAFSEFAKANTLRMRRNRTLAFAKGDDVKMGILNLKAGDIVAFDYTGIIQIVNSSKVKVEASSSRTRAAGSGSQMVSGESYVVQQDCDLLLNVVLEDTTAIINKMYVGAVPGRSDSKAIDFVTAGEEFETLEFGNTSSVYIHNKEKAVNFKWLENDSDELPIDHKISTEGGNGELGTSGLAAGNRRIAIYDLGVGDRIKLRFSGGNVTYEGHETNGDVVSINGRRLTPQDTLQTGDVITVDKLKYLYNYVVLKLDSKVSVSGIYINAEENEKVWMPTIVDKGNNTVLITAGQSSTGNKVTTCYTTDGSEPTRTNGTSGPYDEFDVQLLKGGIVTIKAVSFTDGGVYSRVAELTIFADDLIGGGNPGSAGTRRATGTYDMQGNKVEAVRNGRLYIRDGKVVFFGVEK